MIPILLLMLAVPAVFMALIALIKSRPKELAIVSSAIMAAMALYVLASYLMGMQFPQESYSYIGSLGISFGLSATPISIILVLLSSIVILAAALTIGLDSRRKRIASILTVLFQFASTGLFLSANLFVLFIFWDIGVIAMFFMIYLLGGPNRRAASMRFLMYEIFASTMLLLGIILLFSMLGTADIGALVALAKSLSLPRQLAILVPLLLAFMVNMPVFPFHAWLPDAHTEASTEGSMMLSGVLTKFGGFGMLLTFSILPLAIKYSPYIAALAVISAIYSAFVMLGQTDMKRIVAYSTIVEMGIILVAIASGTQAGTAGAVIAMLAHALTVAFMFLIVGMLHKTFGERDIRLLKGAVVEAPALAYAFILGALAMVGLPLTTAFAGDVLMFIGIYGTFGIIGLVPLAAIVLMGAALYFVMQKSLFEANNCSTAIDLVGPLPTAAVFILMFFILLFGFMPHIVASIL